MTDPTSVLRFVKRLLNQSRAQARSFQELRQYFTTERFLYRVSKS